MEFNINFEMTELERQQNCLKTVINMLIARNWLDDNFDKYYALLLSTNTKDFIDMVNIKCTIDKKVAIKFYNYKLNTFKNDKEIETFISTYPDHHKILIVTDISTKAEKQLIDSSDFEVFKQMEIIKDISKHHLVPKHILLSKEDGEKVMSEYKIKKKDMARIYIDDPMARYLYAQKDNIIQIIRESINCGYSTSYRLVVLGSIHN
jgi:DNA-directed RNA polymerase subunit H (RpoH/RPB5)